MKKNLILFFAMAIAFASCGGDDNDTPNPNPNNKLKLKKVVTTYIPTGKYSDKEETTTSTEYGANGYISKLTYIANYAGKIENGERVYTYNDKNQLIKREDFRYNEKDSEIIYYYNKKGLISNSIETGRFGNEENQYIYNEKNQLIKKISKHKNYKETTTYYEYDENGKLSQTKQGNDITTFTFDDNKNPFSIVFPKEYNLTAPDELFDNNVLTSNDEWRKSIYMYNYNKEGFPSQATRTRYSSSNTLNDTQTTEFFYE
ncbi:MAG: hypothetical protein KGV44_14495 [Flavobacteriaceae bacterium]|nr:hypothetical protein [Flavobacteriaceae bacterium]